jgi:hypothetical protein
VTRGDYPFEIMPAGSTEAEAKARVEALCHCPENVAIHMQWGWGRIEYDYRLTPEGPLPLPGTETEPPK